MIINNYVHANSHVSVLNQDLLQLFLISRIIKEQTKTIKQPLRMEIAL